MAVRESLKNSKFLKSFVSYSSSNSIIDDIEKVSDFLFCFTFYYNNFGEDKHNFHFLHIFQPLSS